MTQGVDDAAVLARLEALAGSASPPPLPLPLSAPPPPLPFTIRKHPRAALILTGFLRDSCASNTTLSALVGQVEMCRTAFDGACDVFIHTWSRLDKDGDTYGTHLKFGALYLAGVPLPSN